MASAGQRQTNTTDGLDHLIIFLGFLVAGILLVASLNAPALHVDRLWVFSRDITLLEGINKLMESGQAALGLAVLCLSVGLPLAKVLTGLIITAAPKRSGPLLQGLVGLFSFLGKWSLADVIVLAVLVMILDGQVLTGANLGLGAYLFASSVILSTVATAWLHLKLRRLKLAS